MAGQQLNGQSFILLGGNGKTMVPIERTGLALGQVVSYGNMAMDRQKAVVVETEGGMYGQRAIFVESFGETNVSRTAIEAPEGWQYEQDAPWSPEAIEELVIKCEQAKQRLSDEQERKHREREDLTEHGRELAKTMIPAWAKAAIIAERQVDESDMMTDYHGSRIEERMLLGWSKHTRDLFSEMRKAALLSPETAHLGPGRDDWKPRVCFAEDFYSSRGENFYEGQYSPYHRELDHIDGEPACFETQAEANAFIEQQGEPEAIHIGGSDELAHFEWRTTQESYEHREKYSMGAGYYLKDGRTHKSGWRVSKMSLGYSGHREGIYRLLAEGAYVPAIGGKSQTQEKAVEQVAEVGDQITGIQVTQNTERGGIEIVFPGKPSDSVRDGLKARGFRWSRSQGLWYAKYTEERWAFAQGLALALG